jgi:hypothetical protein
VRSIVEPIQRDWPLWRGSLSGRTHAQRSSRFIGLRLSEGAMSMTLYVAVLFLAPHTSGPRDVPRCGALSLLQKTPHYRGYQAETAARLKVKLWVLVVVVVVTGAWDLTYPLFSRNPLAGAFAGVRLCFCTSLLATRCPARVARSPRPCLRPRNARTCLICCSLLSFFNQCRNRRRQNNVQTVSAAAKTLPTTPTRER